MERLCENSVPPGFLPFADHLIWDKWRTLGASPGMGAGLCRPWSDAGGSLSPPVSLTLSLFYSLTPLQMETVKQGVDQKLVEGQEKLHQMWLNWNQKRLQGTEQTLAKPEVPAWGDTRGAWGPDMPLHASLPDGPTCPVYFPQPLLLLTAFRHSSTSSRKPAMISSLGCGCCL